MQTQTLDQLKRAMAQKIKVTKTGVEISAKGDTPDEAVATVLKAYELYQHRGAAPAEDKDRSEYPALILMKETALGRPCYIISHGNGTATGYDPKLQELSEDYRVKIDLIQNTKGIGWEVTAKGASMEETIALIDYTEVQLRKHFAPGEATVS